jgi:uncharacterized phage-associated protein
MLSNHERGKLINVIIYFASNTKRCGKTKLFKLLYFLDFEHFRKTGRSVTGLDYYAWKMGPVPVELMDEIIMPDPDMAEKVEFQPVPTRFHNDMLLIQPKAGFDDAHFTKRELRLLERLASEYKDKNADDMVEATHLETLPWHRVYYDEGKRQALIPYEYALKPEEADAVLSIAAENQEIVQNYNEPRNPHR